MTFPFFAFAFFVGTAVCASVSADPSPPPNIVWIVVDDMSPNFGCYGEKLIDTPHVDRLAKEGTRFDRAFVTCPVCSPCRSALITGMYQTSIGAHHHRSGRGTEKIVLPEGVEPVPAVLRRAGYHTSIGGPLVDKNNPLGKTDYNFEWDRSMYDGADWSNRKPGQPFFAQVQLHGGKYRHAANWTDRARRELGDNTATEGIVLPPYYPADPTLLDDWAQYLDCCRYTDRQVGDVIARLEREQLLEHTVIFFMTDHGISHARGKQFLYDEGTRIPLIVRGPGVSAGVVRDDLVEHIDLAAATLALAGVERPQTMQGRNILAPDYRPRSATFAARDRCDETVDHLRSVRTEGFKYIRNYLHRRPHLQPSHYKDAKPIVKRLRELHAEGKLPEVSERLLFAPERAPEELYDLVADPHELTNLAGDPQYAETLAGMRQQLADWEESTNDQGRTPEQPAMFESDMQVYLNEMTIHRSPATDEFKRNLEQMRRWAAEGK